MKLKERMQNSFFALSDNRLLGRKKLAISYVSLFLVFTLVLVTTVAWFTVKDTASINSQAFSLESSAALRVNDGQEDLSNHLVVKGFKLEEASSVDGRNMFFPSEGNFKDSTSAMKFREGTAGDRNKTYVYKDFKLNADSDMTNVYIKGYNITIVSADGKTVLGKFDGSTEIIRNDKGVPVDQKVYDPCPLRLAFITDSSKTPTVIDPSALIDEHAKNYNAVSSTNMNGSPATKLSSCKTFSDFYFYSGESLFTLLGQKPLDVTLVAWFEGAYEDQSVYDKYAGASVTIDVELESNYNDMEAITFIDKTIGDKGENTPWIKTDDCIVTMQYKDTDTTQKTVVMKYLGSVDGYNTWTAALPKDVTTDISFFRFSTTNNIIYNSWHTKDNVNNELSPTAQGWIVNNEDLYPLQESRIVNGPSLDRSTLISAPKTPLSVTVFFSLQADRIYSYNLFALSGLPAFVKEGRFPFLQSAHKVNCDTIRSSPFTSVRERFVLPFSSANIRSPSSLRINLSATSSVSSSNTPTNTSRPFPIFPTSLSSTVTLA